MSHSPDPNDDSDFNFDDLEGDADPFAESPAPEGEGADPFDFSEGEEPPAKSGKPPPTAKAAASKTKSPPKKTKAPSAPKTEKKAHSLAGEVPVQVVAVLGKKAITVQDLVSLKKGQVVELNRFPNEAIDLVANGKLMAKGELVEIDGKLGVRIIKIFE